MRKLTLSKETIRKLTPGEMGNVVGGIGTLPRPRFEMAQLSVAPQKYTTACTHQMGCGSIGTDACDDWPNGTFFACDQ